ncbi:MAG TPA: hypothetical protein V6D22_11640, partial [Candidatus Obscuribacterales bacterium]
MVPINGGGGAGSFRPGAYVVFGAPIVVGESAPPGTDGAVVAPPGTGDVAVLVLFGVRAPVGLEGVGAPVELEGVGAVDVEFVGVDGNVGVWLRVLLGVSGTAGLVAGEAKL